MFPLQGVRPPLHLWFLKILFFVYLSIDYYNIIGKNNSAAAFESDNGPNLQSDAQLSSPNTVTCNPSPHEEFSGFPSPNDVKQSGKQNYAFNCFMNDSRTEIQYDVWRIRTWFSAIFVLPICSVTCVLNLLADGQLQILWYEALLVIWSYYETLIRNLKISFFVNLFSFLYCSQHFHMLIISLAANYYMLSGNLFRVGFFNS